MAIQQTQALRHITFCFGAEGSLTQVFRYEERQLRDDESDTVLSADTLVSTLYDVAGSGGDVEALQATLADLAQKVSALAPANLHTALGE
ncbi:hypothetical protein [Burkholderia cenocepacia]|uniref:hypothetical protein n=1 Tax=Burkholderia cenocepacia TaxID=95486 RepID=UPI001BA3C114|nr:hypothetical protein [Burkholderia cenocepacia]MBR8137175.1 hypothetical protein [Burkholderia cenocepacia]